jgi:acetyl esterase/lipase
MPVRLRNCRAQWIDARLSTERRQAILYLPGGGFIVGGWHLHRAFIARLSRRTNTLVLAVDYRKLPRHQFGAAAEDAIDAYRHLLRDGISPRDIIVAGDSAGGFLALLLTHRAKQAGLPAPCAIVAISPLLTLAQIEPVRRGCAVIPRRGLSALARFAGVDPDCDDDGPMGLAEPDMPPVLLHAARDETLAGQVIAYDKLLTQRGVPHQTQLWPVDVHVFHAAPWLPEAAQALESIADFVDGVSSASAPALSA